LESGAVDQAMMKVNMAMMVAAWVCAEAAFTVAMGVKTISVEVRARMWEELRSACTQGLCHRHSNTSSAVSNTTDCKGRLLAYEYGLQIQPGRGALEEVFDALELHTCGVTLPKSTRSSSAGAPRKRTPNRIGSEVYVDFDRGEDAAGRGSKAAPLKTLAFAVAQSRTLPAPRDIILRAGIHFLTATVELQPVDSGLTIRAYDGEDVWVSGGISVSPAWTKAPLKGNVWQAHLPDVDDVRGLNTLSPYRRVTRAREPNGDPELCTDCWHGSMKGWHKDLSCVGKAQVVYKDLRDCNDEMKLPDGSPCKNDSAMWDTYNTYSNGHGGCCAAWEGDQSPYGPMGDYYCGNASAGGWVGYDDPRGSNRSQGLSPALPVGFDYDAKKYPLLSTIKNAAGAVLHVWRAQGWYVNMFEVATHDPSTSSMTFAQQNGHVKGGWQGGRGWQVDASKINSSAGDYLIAGQWMLEGALELLDAPNEYHWDSATHMLSLWPNSTSPSAAPDKTLVVVNLHTLLSLNASHTNPVTDVTIQGLRFRDGADISLLPWGVPSGGDWGLHRGGAIFMEGTHNCAVDNCTFERLDGNAIMVSGYNRNATVQDSEFSWLGHSAVAGWGYTNENDGTDGLQPHFTNIVRNYVREIGIIQKQSSAWFQAKTAQSNVDSNIIFNGPRAGINLNDGFGGNSTFSRNLIFNECRETGDHGPINAWDRTAYLSTVLYGHPSYEAAMNHVLQNFIIANYGSSQGFDTDDGTSWYNISRNFFFQADATKMDYGGHDMVFAENLVYVRQSDGQNCFNQGSYLPGHGLVYERNKCILPFSKTIGHLSGCNCPGNASNVGRGGNPQTECGVTLRGNEYYGIDMNLTVDCGGTLAFQDFQTGEQELGSHQWALPTDDELLFFAREKLDMPEVTPPPPPPKPLPPAPHHNWPNTCEGRCGKAGHCCVGFVCGCSQPNCDMGCYLANTTKSLGGCLAECAKAMGKCSYQVGKVDFQMCQDCPNADGCQGCDTHTACSDGCHFAFP